MSAAWDLDVPSTEKMVLMCLCDFANDDGSNCWPSVPTLARKCSKSERTVQAAIQSLQKMGFLKIQERAGTSNSFSLNPRKICAPTPAEVAPRKNCAPQKTTNTPAESAPKPPRTTNNSKGARAIPDDWVPDDFQEGAKCQKVIDDWPPGELEMQVEQFKANHKAKGNTFDDFQAAWKTWVLNSRKFGIARPANDRQPPSNRNTAELTRQKLAALGQG